MPIYEYHCVTCGREFEKLVAGQSPVRCPDCSGLDVSRRLSLFGVKSASAGSPGGGGGGCGCGRGG